MRSLLLFVSAVLAITISAQDPCEELVVQFNYEDHPDGIQFFDASSVSGAIFWYQWTFGDGGMSFAQNPVHTFASNGIYEVCLTIHTVIGTDTCMEAHCEMVEYDASGSFTCDQYNSSFTVEDLGENTVQFLSTTDPPGGNHNWTFGDGGSSIGQQATHTYDQPGDYTVCLFSYIWNDNSQEICQSTTCMNITVGGSTPQCDSLFALFSYSQVPGSTEVSFQHSAMPPALDLQWDLGDGTFLSGTSVEHEFPSFGTYQVCLTAEWWDQAAQTLCGDTHCELIHVVDTIGCDTAFQVSIDHSVFGGSVILQANSDFPIGGANWQLGDGSVAEGPQVEHNYADTGSYEVCVEAWMIPEGSTDTCWASSCIWIEPFLDSDCDQLQAGFEGTSTSAGMQFTNTSSLIGISPNFEWDFGDGSIGEGPDPFHNYTAPGEYEVCHTVSSSIGPANDPIMCSSTFCDTIHWQGNLDPCVGSEASYIATSLGGLSMQFTNTSVPPGNGHSWDLGDGAVIGGAEVTHTYSAPGTYEVCLSLWNWNEALQDTCWLSICEEHVIEAAEVPCDSTFAVTFSWQQMGPSFTFTADAGPLADGIIWEIDGTSASGNPVTQLFEPPGPYMVCAYAWYWNESLQDSCWASHCETVEWTIAECDPDFEISIEHEVQGNAVTFIAGSNIPADGFIWDFGDGTSGTGDSIIHLFEPPGPYVICVDAWYWEASIGDTCWAESCITVDPFLSIEELSGSGFLIYPQPASDHLVIDIEGHSGSFDRSELIDMQGRIVRSDRPVGWPHLMDLSSVPGGTYVLRCTGDRTLRSKVLIVK